MLNSHLYSSNASEILSYFGSIDKEENPEQRRQESEEVKLKLLLKCPFRDMGSPQD